MKLQRGIPWMNAGAFVWATIWLGVGRLPAQTPAELIPLRYNNPGLVVDLGVGLWAWPVPWDADEDGDYDLLVSCPDKPSNGIWFFENKQGDTRNNKFPVFEPARRLSRTVHYVTPSYVDGGLRVMAPGVEFKNFTTTGIESRVELPIKGNFYRPQWNQTKGPKVRHNQWRYVDYEGDGALDLVVGIEDWSDYGWDAAWDANGQWKNGPLHGLIYLFHNSGSTQRPNYDQPVAVEAAGKRIDVFGCPSPNFIDFDDDGDLDLLCGEFLDGFTYFENLGSRETPNYVAGVRLQTADGQRLAMDLEMIVPVAFDWDRDGDHDLIVGDEDGRVALIENIADGEGKQTRPNEPKQPGRGQVANGPPKFSAPRYFQQRADTLKCGALATPVSFDWDCDGDADILSGNTAGTIEFFENITPETNGRNETADLEKVRWAAPVKIQEGDQTFRVMAGANLSVQGPAEAKWGYTTFSIADWDGDGLPDICFNSILGKIQWLKNIGQPTAPKFAPRQSIRVEWPTELASPPKPEWTWWTPTNKELVTQWRTTPVARDFTGDGLTDLAVLDVEGYFSLLERGRSGDGLILLPPQRVFCDENGKPLRFNEKSGGGSGRRKLCVVDWDGDGVLDLLLNSSNADFYRGLGRERGQWRFQRVGSLAKQNIEGHDVSPTTIDLGGTGIPDFLGGAEDGRFYFLANPRHASQGR